MMMMMMIKRVRRIGARTTPFILFRPHHQAFYFMISEPSSLEPQGPCGKDAFVSTLLSTPRREEQGRLEPDVQRRPMEISFS